MNEIKERLKLLEQRLDKIEHMLGDATLSAPTPSQSEKLTRTNSWDDLQPKTLAEEPSPIPAPEESTARAISSGNWLGIIAIICFVFAAGFIIKLSVESGWLTPTRQIIIAAIFGLALMSAGLFLRTRYSSYASLLPAAGIIILYLCVFAEYGIYSLTTFNTALILTTLVSLMCIWLYWVFKHDVYAIVAVIGAYASPIILDMNYSSNFTFYYYMFCSFTFATLSIWTSSRLMTILSAYLAILCTFVVEWTYGHDTVTTAVLAGHFMIFSISTYLYSIWHKVQLTEVEAWAFFPVLVLFYGIEYFLIYNNYPALAPYLSLLFAALLIALYLLAKQCFPQQDIKSQGMIYAFASLVLFHSVYLELIPTEVKPWLFAVIVLTVAFVSSNKRQNRVFYIPIMMVALIALIEYVSILSQLFLNQYNLSTLLAGCAAFASIWIAIRTHYTGAYQQEEYGVLFLGAAHLLAIVGLYRLAEPTGSLAVTCFWLIYAIIVLGFAYYCKDKLMAHSALLVLGLAAGKALLYDASMTPTAVRILCLLFTGAVLYSAGLLMKKIAQWDEPE